MPTACAATRRREWSSVPSATFMPLPSSPIRLAAGMRTSSKIGWPVGEPFMASLCSSFPTMEPARAGGAAVGLGEDDVEVGDPEVGDPVLGAVDHPLAAVALGARDHAAGI